MNIEGLSRIRLMTVDDHPLFREGIASVLEKAADIELVAEASNGREAIATYRECLPDITLMDIQMPDLNGIETTCAIRREFPQAKIIVLTTYEGDVHALRAIKAGAWGYMLKSMVRREMVDIIRTVHAGKRYIPAGMSASLAQHLHGDALSPREVQVLELAATGKSNRLIGVQLRISEETVKVHMKSILAKLSAHDRTHAVLLGIERGIIDIRMHLAQLAS